jgi:hypothetical protein
VLKIGPQVWRIVLTGAGIGMMLGQTNTAALNRATDGTYGEATGITQTVRNYGSSLGLAVLGTILAHSSFFHATFNQISDGPSPPSNGAFGLIPLEAREAFANSIQHVLYAMSAIMGVAAVIALLTMQRGHIEGTADLST